MTLITRFPRSCEAILHLCGTRLPQSLYANVCLTKDSRVPGIHHVCPRQSDDVTSLGQVPNPRPRLTPWGKSTFITRRLVAITTTYLTSVISNSRPLSCQLRVFLSGTSRAAKMFITSKQTCRSSRRWGVRMRTKHREENVPSYQFCSFPFLPIFPNPFAPCPGKVFRAYLEPQTTTVTAGFRRQWAGLWSDFVKF